MRLLKELGIRRVRREISSTYILRAVLSEHLSGRRGCYSPTKKDVNIAVQIRVEAAALAGW